MPSKSRSVDYGRRSRFQYGIKAEKEKGVVRVPTVTARTQSGKTKPANILKQERKERAVKDTYSAKAFEKAFGVTKSRKKRDDTLIVKRKK